MVDRPLSIIRATDGRTPTQVFHNSDSFVSCCVECGSECKKVGYKEDWVSSESRLFSKRRVIKISSEIWHRRQAHTRNQQNPEE